MAVFARFTACKSQLRLIRGGTKLAHDDAKMRRVEATKQRVSFADLQRMPEDGKRYELYDGELHVVPAPVPIHQLVAQRLFAILLDFSRHSGGQVFVAPFDIVLTEFDVVEPDLIYFGPEAAKRIKPREYVRFPPDIAVEVLSPSTARIDRGRKRDLLARHGVPEYWIVDPDVRTLEAHVLAEGRYGTPISVAAGRFESAAQPGLAVEVEPLFVWFV
jgi:Uma2 family endonuclease